MKVIAFKGNKDGFDWVVVEGNDRTTATIIKRDKSPAPADNREAQLAWIAKEVAEHIETYSPEHAATHKIGGGSFSDALVARVEVDGVIRAALGAPQIPTQAIKGVSLAKKFGVKKIELPELLDTFPCMGKQPKVHRELLSLALAQLPASHS